jgi:hypothetical protein
MNSEKNQDQDQGQNMDQLQHPDQEDPRDPFEELSLSEFVSWFFPHQRGNGGWKYRRVEKKPMAREKDVSTHKSSVISNIKEKRTKQAKEAKDRILNITRANGTNGTNRATGNVGMECMICGKEIRPNQAFRALPKDKNCQEERFYHLRTCGPGSLRWKAFKGNDRRISEDWLPNGQMSFKWGK